MYVGVPPSSAAAGTVGGITSAVISLTIDIFIVAVSALVPLTAVRPIDST